MQREGGKANEGRGSRYRGFKRQIQNSTRLAFFPLPSLSPLLSVPLPPPLSVSTPLALSLSGERARSSSFTSLDICTRVYAGEPVIPAVSREPSNTEGRKGDGTGIERDGGNREGERYREKVEGDG